MAKSYARASPRNFENAPLTFFYIIHKDTQTQKLVLTSDKSVNEWISERNFSFTVIFAKCTNKWNTINFKNVPFFESTLISVAETKVD